MHRFFQVYASGLFPRHLSALLVHSPRGEMFLAGKSGTVVPLLTGAAGAQRWDLKNAIQIKNTPPPARPNSSQTLPDHILWHLESTLAEEGRGERFKGAGPEVVLYCSGNSRMSLVRSRGNCETQKSQKDWNCTEDVIVQTRIPAKTTYAQSQSQQQA